MDGDRSPARSRSLDIGGAVNFRCVEVPPSGQRFLKKDFLFRSGTISHISEVGVQSVRRLEIRTMVDLRSEPERHAYPSPMVSALGLRDIGQRHDIRFGNLGALLRSGSSSPGEIREEMLEMYRVIPYAFAAVFSHAIEQMVRHRGPLLIHCSAGKDRTGILVALILSALGFSRDDIVAEYVRTAACCQQIADDLVNRRGDIFRQLRREFLAPIIDADPDYLHATFDAIGQRSGDVFGYLKSVGIGAKCVYGLEEIFLS